MVFAIAITALWHGVPAGNGSLALTPLDRYLRSFYESAGLYVRKAPPNLKGSSSGVWLANWEPYGDATPLPFGVWRWHRVILDVLLTLPAILVALGTYIVLHTSKLRRSGCTVVWGRARLLLMTCVLVAAIAALSSQLPLMAQVTLFYVHAEETGIWARAENMGKDLWGMSPPLYVTVRTGLLLLPLLVVALLFVSRLGYRVCAEGGVRYCRTCGYDLRGSPSDRCSECGAPILYRGATAGSASEDSRCTD